MPRYALLKWLPVIGSEAFGLWLVMRDMARVEAARSDSWCWPDQNQLAETIGVSKNTLRKLLELLERHGFIRCERRREKGPRNWGMVQGTNHYEVFVDVPLVEADAIEALLAQTVEEGDRAEFKTCTQRLQSAQSPLSSKSAPSGAGLKSCTQPSEEIQALSPAEFKSCVPNVSNEDNLANVRENRSKGIPLREHPLVRQLTATEKRERARLAIEIGEGLQRMSGTRESGPHRSLGFHRRVAFILGPVLVHEALSATRDAVEARRAGRGGVRQDPAAFFGGIVKELARQHGIDLGLSTRSTDGAVAPREPIETPAKSSTIAGRRIEEGDHQVSADERARVRKMLCDLVKGWESRPSRPAR